MYLKLIYIKKGEAEVGVKNLTEDSSRQNKIYNEIHFCSIMPTYQDTGCWYENGIITTMNLFLKKNYLAPVTN